MIDYDPHHWVDHLLDVKGSMVRQITSRVLLCAAWSVVVVVLIRYQFPWLAVTDRAHFLIGLALGLLLVFRTNSSYDRFWEGRKQWGSIVNETRNLARAASTFLADAPERVHTIITWTITFPYATMNALRGGRGLGEAASSLPRADVEAVLKVDHLPLAVTRQISREFAEARKAGLVSDYVHMTLDQNVQLLVDYMGACERIQRTPLPFAYVVHLRRALLVYCFTLPFALYEAFGWATVLVTLFIAYTMFGIEEIGVEIESPFGMDDNDLPLERFCTTIERDLRAMLPEPDAVADGAVRTAG